MPDTQLKLDTVKIFIYMGYLPKSQFVIKNLSELDENFNLPLVNNLGEEVNVQEVVLTSFGTVFEKKGINLDSGDFTKAIQLFSNPAIEEDAEPTAYIDDEGNFEPLPSSGTPSLKLPPKIPLMELSSLNEFTIHSLTFPAMSYNP